MRRCICTRGGLVAGWATIYALVISHPGEGRAARPDSSRLMLQAEYGTSLALTGNLAAAESVFVSLLSVSPKDPRALTNLGNLSLLRGELRTATVFYQEALRREPSDPGIRLNLAAALLMQGRKAEATREAAAALPKAGGVAGALDLLGVRGFLPETQKPKAGEESFLSGEELRDLLEAAVRAIPVDSSSVAADSVAADSVRTAQQAEPDSGLGEGNGASGSAKAHPKESAPSQPGASGNPINRRPAGSRASDAGGAGRVLYWKQ